MTISCSITFCSTASSSLQPANLTPLKMLVIVVLLEVLRQGVEWGSGTGRPTSRRNAGHRKCNLQHTDWGHSRSRRRQLRRTVFYNCTAAFQTALQASFAANPTGANGIFLPTALQTGGVNLTGGGFLDPDYKSPRSIQMNIGIQRELVREWYLAPILFETSGCTT